MRVLVVEDEPRMVDLLRRGLEEEGYVVTTARDGPTGLDAALHCDFEVLILDIMLPGMNGFELARRLRGAQRQIPILMLTARDAV